jgi:hypothetical protein
MIEPSWRDAEIQSRGKQPFLRESQFEKVRNLFGHVVESTICHVFSLENFTAVKRNMRYSLRFQFLDAFHKRNSKISYEFYHICLSLHPNYGTVLDEMRYRRSNCKFVWSFRFWFSLLYQKLV